MNGAKARKEEKAEDCINEQSVKKFWTCLTQEMKHR